MSSSESMSPVEVASRPRAHADGGTAPTVNGFTALNGRKSPNHDQSVLQLSESPRTAEPNRRSRVEHEGWEPNGTTNGTSAPNHSRNNVDLSSPSSGNPPKRRRVEFEEDNRSPTIIARSAAATLEQNAAERSRDDPSQSERYPSAHAGVQRENWPPKSPLEGGMPMSQHSVHRDVHPNGNTPHPDGRPVNGASSGNISTAEYTVLKSGAQVQMDPTKKRKRAFTNRTKTGCQTCRKRKKKCDETKPWCNNCTRGNFTCEGYAHAKPTYAGKSGNVPRPPMQSIQPQPRTDPAYYEASQRPVRAGMYEPPKVADGRLPAIEDNFHSRAPHHGSWPSTYSGSRSRPSAGQDRILESSRSSLPMSMNAPTNLAPIMQFPPQPHALSIATRSLDAPRIESSPRVESRASTAALHSHSSQYPPSSEPLNMKSGNLFDPNCPQLVSDRERCQAALSKFNSVCAGNSTSDTILLNSLLGDILCEQTQGRQHHGAYATRLGNQVKVDTPFHCAYGYNISLGNNVWVKDNCKILDACEVSFGANTIVDSGVEIRGCSTPWSLNQRRMLKGFKIKIGVNVYIGAGVRIFPSELEFTDQKRVLEIGDGAWIAPGTLVTTSVPSNVMFAGGEGKTMRGFSSD